MAEGTPESQLAEDRGPARSIAPPVEVIRSLKNLSQYPAAAFSASASLGGLRRAHRSQSLARATMLATKVTNRSDGYIQIGR